MRCSRFAMDTLGTGRGSIEILTADVGGAFSTPTSITAGRDGDSHASVLAPDGTATVVWRDLASTQDDIDARTTRSMTHQPAPPNWLVVPKQLTFTHLGAASAGKASCPGWYSACNYKVTIGTGRTLLAIGKVS